MPQITVLRRLAVVLLGSSLMLGLAGCGLAVVEDGQVGVKADFGHIKEQALGPGWHWYLPVFSWVEVWDVKTQELKEVATVPSSEGLISQLDVSVLYNVPKEQAVSIRTTIGSDYRETVVEPYVRESIRNVVSGYGTKSLFSEAGRKEIGEQILTFLKAKLEPRGLVVQDVLLRDVRLPPTFATSIEAKLRAEQESLQKEFELVKAKKDAEIEVARAGGVAKSNEIIGASITENYLRYRWIEGLQGNRETVVYVPTEANLPILEAGRWQEDIDRNMKNQGKP